jgi:hypothetical protein
MERAPQLQIYDEHAARKASVVMLIRSTFSRSISK